jgi:hypothetical protein
LIGLTPFFFLFLRRSVDREVSYFCAKPAPRAGRMSPKAAVGRFEYDVEKQERMKRARPTESGPSVSADERAFIDPHKHDASANLPKRPSPAIRHSSRIHTSSAPKGALSGIWRASARTEFRIDDDGKTAAVELRSSDVLTVFSGKLYRRGEGSDDRSYAGILQASFKLDASQRYSIKVTATLENPADKLLLRFDNWPVWNAQGTRVGTETLSAIWTRR